MFNGDKVVTVNIYMNILGFEIFFFENRPILGGFEHLKLVN